MSYLPAGLPAPTPENDGLSAPYWQGLTQNRLLVQRCPACKTWQWGPEWICHQCHRFDPEWVEVEARGTIYAFQRVWHPVHPALKGHGPYIAALVELPSAGSIRMLGNLLGDPQINCQIGDAVTGQFEHHPNRQPAYSLLHWRRSF